MGRAGAFLLGCGLLTAMPVTAQETIASDRPGIGSGSAVIDAGVLQAEFGAAYLGGAGPDAVALGQLFVRYGLGRLELEFLGSSWVDVRSPADGADMDGFEDAAVGAKVRLGQGIGGRMDLSLQGLLTLPTGSDGVGSEEWLPALVALADVGLGESTAVSLNLGARKGSGAVPDQLAASVTPALSLSDRLSGYAGWAGTFDDSDSVHWLEAGLAFLATPDVQLDINGATSPDTDQWFVGLGMAVRTGSR
jgi:hypothetical protein